LAFERIRENMSVRSSIANTFAFLLLGCATTGYVQAQALQVPDSPASSESGVVIEAAVVLQELTTGTAERIPGRLLAEAHAIAIVPHYMRGAFVVGVSGGRGVVATRDQNGNWLAPEFITLGGGSVGWQIGVQATDLVLVFRSPQSLANLRQGKVTLGADASVAAGPLGRYTSASTDARFQAEILTYSRSRGLFAGVSLSGAVLQPDMRATQSYYQIGPGSPGVVPASAQALVNALTRFTATAAQSDGFPVLPAPSPAETGFAQSAPVATDLDPRLIQLFQAASALQAKVDIQWKQYLELPAAWFTGKPLTSEEVHYVLVRYERVETNPQFATLRSQPEFQTVLRWLRDLASQLSPAATQLVLPPPPASGLRP
jgi:lipid-binding SYLF domain-containing protein